MCAHVSNANQRAAGGDRKAVFKSVLDNPFKVAWPHVPLNVQNVVLASLVTLLTDVGEYHLKRQSMIKKRKRAMHAKQRKARASACKRRKVGEDKATAPDSTSIAPGIRNDQDDGIVRIDTEYEPDIELPTPPVMAHLTLGINQVTKRLETLAASRRPRASVYARDTPAPVADNLSAGSRSSPLTYVFVCRADIDPPLLIAHFPELVAACNIPGPSSPLAPVYLVPLPKQSEHTLAEIIGLRRVSVLALDSLTPSLTTISSLLTSVQPPSAPWLTGPAPQLKVAHAPTHIKQIHTTAPRDMRVAKQARKEGQQAAKEKNVNRKTRKANKIHPNKSSKKNRIVSSKSIASQAPLLA